jgi:hypothetical protein
LPLGPKPFVDDGNSFYGLGPIPAITHGPRAGGQHTVNEWVDIDDMVRVSALYALTAVVYCTTGQMPAPSEAAANARPSGCAASSGPPRSER